MYHALLGLLMLCTPCQQDGRSEPETLKQRYEALLRQYAKPRPYYGNNPEQGKAAAQSFFELARERPDDEVAADALGWVATNCLFQTQAGEAMKLLAEDHVDSERLVSFLQDIVQYYGAPFEPIEGLCRSAIDRSRRREVRGWARFTLARQIRAVKEMAERQAIQYQTFLNRKSGPFVPEPRLTPADLERLTDEAAALLHRVIEDYKEDAPDEKGLVAEAKSELVELQGISIGKVAPDIVGRDLDGKTFNLSDYRGKVVVLTFSGNWCGPCRAMYPDERKLVERLRASPFVLLSVNTDEAEATLRKSIESGEITWRCWFDGGIGGPITTRWSIDGFPTIYVLDARGVIRYKNAMGSVLDEAVDTLLREPLKPQVPPAK